MLFGGAKWGAARADWRWEYGGVSLDFLHVPSLWGASEIGPSGGQTASQCSLVRSQRGALSLSSLSLSIVHVHVHVPPTPTLLFFFLSLSHCFDLLIMRDDQVSNFYPHVLRTVLVGSQD